MRRLRWWGFRLAVRNLRDPAMPVWFRRLSNRVALRLGGDELQQWRNARRYRELVKTARGE